MCGMLLRVPSLPVVGNVHWIIKWPSCITVYMCDSHPADLWWKVKFIVFWWLCLLCKCVVCCRKVPTLGTFLLFQRSVECYIFFFKRTFNWYMFYGMEKKNIVLNSLCTLYGLCSHVLFVMLKKKKIMLKQVTRQIYSVQQSVICFRQTYVGICTCNTC